MRIGDIEYRGDGGQPPLTQAQLAEIARKAVADAGGLERVFGTADPFHAPEHSGGCSQEGKGWIAAASGAPINLLDPDPASIRLADVARGLSLTCRFAGQVDRFYSVAEHSALVLDLVRSRYRTISVYAYESWALLHDAHEAYIHDLTGPLKYVLQQLGCIGYAELEARWTEAIRLRFGLPVPDEETVAEVKHFDHLAACLEGGRLKPTEPFYRQYRDELLPEGVHCGFGLSPEMAEARFLNRCVSLGIR